VSLKVVWGKRLAKHDSFRRSGTLKGRPDLVMKPHTTHNLSSLTGANSDWDLIRTAKCLYVVKTKADDLMLFAAWAFQRGPLHEADKPRLRWIEVDHLWTIAWPHT